jgi:hypothetical protein
MALWLIGARFLDLFFIIGPEAYPHGLRFHWLDLAAPIGLGGVWVALFAANLKSRPLLPLHDAGLENALYGEQH